MAKRRACGAGVTACFSAGATVPDCRWSRSPATPPRAVRRPAKTADYPEDLAGIVVEVIVPGGTNSSDWKSDSVVATERVSEVQRFSSSRLFLPSAEARSSALIASTCPR